MCLELKSTAVFFLHQTTHTSVPVYELCKIPVSHDDSEFLELMSSNFASLSLFFSSTSKKMHS